MPSVIKKGVNELEGSIVSHDTVIDDLNTIVATQNIESEDLAITITAYMLGFCSYKGFVNDNSRNLLYRFGGDK